MRVVISTDNLNFKDYTVVKSLKEANTITESIDYLILHKSDDNNSFNAGVLLSDLHKKDVKNFIYINETPDLQIKMLIDGLGGYIFEDEFYLEDEDELNALIENLSSEEKSTSLATPNIDIIKDFMQSFVRGEQRVNQPFYLDRAKNAIQELAVITQKQELTIAEMGDTSLQVFEKASNIIRQMNAKRIELQEQLSHLEEMTSSDNYIQASSKPLSNTINYFSPFKYLGNSKILLVKEYSPCRFLTSFLLSYTHYIHYILNKRVKFIVVYQKGYLTGKRYETMFRSIGDEKTTQMASLYDAELIATNSPKREVMKELFAKQADLFIVLDRTYNLEKIVDGKIKFTLNAVGGAGDLQKYQLNPNTVITSQVFPKNKTPFIFLSSFKDYPDIQDVRYSAYDQQYLHNSEVYKLLDAKVDLLPQ